MKKIFLAALLIPSIALAQSYPAPTFSSVILQNPLTPANGGTGATTSTGAGSVVLSNSPALVTPNLGTPSAVTLTNGTGLPVSTGVSGLGTGVATALGNAVTGSGSPVLATSPTIAGPTLTGTTTTSNLQVNTGISVGPTAASLTKDISVSQSMTGTTAANCTTTTLIMYPCSNLFYVSSDNAAAASGTVLDEWQFAANYGGASLTGGRQLLDVIGNFTAPSSPTNPLPGYVAIAGELITNSGDNGTAPNTTNGRGSFFAMNPVVVANSGAQNLFGIAGEEVNVQCNGCSTAIRFGVSAAQNGANQGSIPANDAAFHVGNVTNISGAWHQALNLSNVNGAAPLDATGCVICTDTTNNTIGTGIDLHNYNITGNFLLGPNGFQVTGAAAVVAPGGIGTSGGLTVSAGGASIAGGLSSSGTVSGAGFTTLLAPYATLASPSLSGTPTAPAPSTATNNTQIATTSFGYNLLASGLAPASFTTLNASGNDALMYTNGSSQTIPNNALTTVTTWTKVADRVNADFNASTGVYTAPATGYYQISGQLSFSPAVGVVATQYTAGIEANGATIVEGTAFQQSTSTTSMSVPFNGVVSLASGQTLQLQAYQNTGSSRTLNSSAALTYMSINRLP